MKPNLNAFRLSCALMLLLIASVGWAQQQTQAATPEAAQPPPAEPGDELGRDTPIDSIKGFVVAAEAFDWELAARYMDLRNLPPSVRKISGATLAEQFYFIIQRRQIEINAELISDKPTGHAIDDLPEYRDHLGQVLSASGPVNLLLQRVPNREGKMIWKLSNKTVAQIPELYAEFSYPQWVERVRETFPSDKSFLGIENFKWVIMLAALAILIPLSWLFFYLVARIFSKPDAQLWNETRSLLTGPVAGLVVIYFASDLLLELGVGATAWKIMQSHTITTAFVVWFVWKTVDLWRGRRRIRYESEGRSDAAVLGRPMANAIKLFTVLIGLLVWLANAGVDISALLAGLGIGGIAVALALQKPIEDLFGAVSIYSQQPVSTGDLCRYGTSVGRVEEIGLRTTRIRTLSNTLVNVPNAQLSTGIIENLTARTKIIYQPDLPLRYDTTREQLMKLMSALETMLEENPTVEPETIRVRLHEFGANAIVVRIRIFALTREFETYLSLVQEINLDIMDIMRTHGVSFSQGAQTLFLKREKAEKGRDESANTETGGGPD